MVYNAIFNIQVYRDSKSTYTWFLFTSTTLEVTEVTTHHTPPTHQTMTDIVFRLISNSIGPNFKILSYNIHPPFIKTESFL